MRSSSQTTSRLPNKVYNNCCPCHHQSIEGSADEQVGIEAAAAAVNAARRHIQFYSSHDTLSANSQLHSRTASGDGAPNSSLLVPSSILAPSAPSHSSLEHRVEELEERLEKSLQQNVILHQQILKLESNQAQSESANVELYRRLGVLITTTGTLSERMKSLETTSYDALATEIAQLRSESEARENDISRLLVNFKQELTQVASGTSAMVAENKRFLEESQKASLPAPTLQDLTRNLEAEVERLVSIILDDFQRAQSTALQDMGKRLEQELDKRHRRLVDSTHQAVSEAAKGYETTAPQIRTLQNDLLQIREQIRVQSVQIDTQRNDTSFEVAINEMKDWIQDIERKLITRTEVEETIIQLSSQISSLKHSSQSNEALLSQKLEVEKSARESAVSQLASQLLLSGRKR